MLAMEGKGRNMSRVRVYLTHLLPELQRIQKRRTYSLTQRQRAVQLAADMCLVRSANKGFAWTRALNLRLLRKEKRMTTRKKMNKSPLRRSRIITLARRMRLVPLNPRNVDLETGGHDHGAIERRLGALQSLVPGGRNMAVDTFFQETADYISNLQMQVHAMEVLAGFYTTNCAGRVDESVTQQQRSAFCFAQI